MDTVAILTYIIAFFSLFTLNVYLLLYLKHRHEYRRRPEGDPSWRPMVSVIMPAYNEGRFISGSLRSLLGLDYPRDRLEIIVVDDGSTDDTYRVAKSFERKGGPVKVLRKENGGKGAALNFGIKKARGELVATMDADSYVTPSTLSEMIPYFSDPEVMAVTPAVKVKPGGNWLRELQRVEYLMILFSRKLLSYIESVPVTPGPFSLFRSSVFEKVGGFHESNLVEDQEIALRIQSHNFKIRSSLTADVYTEPPESMGELLKQRVRWQRGGFRNYWEYRHMVKPEFGDFGLYSIPMQFAVITAFFALLGIMLYSLLTTPYYYQYIWFDAFGMGINMLTFVAVFLFAVNTLFLYVAVKSFDNEKVKLRYLVSFFFFYWYLMLGYNVLFVLKEIRKEGFSW
jgi:cellulose synthase/poly-beta-1,6-N-acetylglucosamine synthase-like glycosyltransferase